MKNVCVLHDHIGSSLRKGWGNGQNSFIKGKPELFLSQTSVEEMPSLFQLEEAICDEKRMEKTGQFQGSGKSSLHCNENSQIVREKMSLKVSGGFWASPENLGIPLY